jgi:hypothetical protein
MLKPLTFSVSLAVALSACSLGLAGHHDAVYATGQCASPQGVLASPQGYCETGCATPCAPAKKHCLANLFKHKPKCYTYEWVLKKKKCHGGHGNACETGYTGGCDTCGGGVYPSAQGVPYAAPQAYGAPQAFGAGQMGSYGAGQMGSYGAGQMGAYGAGQAVPTTTTVPAGNGGGDVVPPPPGSADPATDGTAPQASNGSLLFLAPAGN